MPGIPGPYHRFANTKVGAQAAEQLAIQQAFGVVAGDVPQKVEVPTFREWFKGQFWEEWVIGRKNKPSEVRSKNIIFDLHLDPRFGDMPLDRVTTSEVARFRASLVTMRLSEKRINNILAVLSKPLKYAVDSEVIAKAPKIGMFKVERPEIVAWDFEQYARLLASAKAEGDEWSVATCLAGEAGLRVGEVKALRWREDVDMRLFVKKGGRTRPGEESLPSKMKERPCPLRSLS